MPWELIYTSAPRGLISGQSGFCTVARTADLREVLAQRLEQISSYHYVEFGSANRQRANPTISAHRMLDIRGTKFHVLSRILPCGLDFTSRTNHLAHHLVFEVDELISLPSPAEILRHWDGWRSAWQGEPRLLDRRAAGSFSHLPPPVWPAETWQQLTGDAGRAAGLLESELSRGCYLITPPGGEQTLLKLFSETLQLLNPTGRLPQRAWQHTFTTFLQAEDAAADFLWRGCQEGTPAYEQAVRRTATLIRIAAVRIPNNPLARLAREGPKLPPTPSAISPLAEKPAPPVHSWRSARPDAYPGGIPKRSAPRKDPYGWTISISHKSLIGFGIAVLLLVGLLATKHLWLGKLKSVAPPRLAANASPTNATLMKAASTNASKPVAPGLAPPPTVASAPVIPKPVEAPWDSVKASQILDKALPTVPTHLLLVPVLPNDDLPPVSLPPLVELLRQFGRISLTPKDLELRFDLNAWGSPAGFKLTVESLPNDHQLHARRGGGIQSESRFVFDYSGLPEKPTAGEAIHLQAHFSREPSPLVNSFSLIFRPAGTFEPFGLLVINESNPPEPLKLSKQFLQRNAPRFEDAFRPPLRARLKLFHLPGPFTWQLRPYVAITNASGAITVGDLYEQLPSDARPNPGTELDFAREIQYLTRQRDEKRDEAGVCQSRLDTINSTPQSVVDLNLPVGAMLGLTNRELANFNAFEAGHQSPGRRRSTLFLIYFQQITEAPNAQQTWLAKWPACPPQWENPHWEEDHFDLVLQKLRAFYDLCATNLPPESVTALTVGSAPNNYFGEGWNSLKRTESIEYFTGEKKAAEEDQRRWQKLVDLMPETLEQTAYVRLFLVDANSRLEVIRFTDSGRGSQP